MASIATWFRRLGSRVSSWFRPRVELAAVARTVSYAMPRQVFAEQRCEQLEEANRFAEAYREAQNHAVAVADVTRLAAREAAASSFATLGRHGTHPPPFHYTPPADDPLFLLAKERMVTADKLRDQFMELPIAVQLYWAGYPVVNAALAQLAYGWYQDASLLSDAVWTDDQVATCTNTRTNALFSRPIEFLAQGEGASKASSDEGPVEIARQAVKRAVKALWNDMLPLAALREVFRSGVFTNLGIGELVYADHGMPSATAEYLAEKLPGVMVPGAVLMPTLKSWNSQFAYWRWDTRSNWLIHQGGQVELHPGNGRWVTYAPQGHNHGFLYGAIRQLGALWLDRKYTYRDWARVEEKFGIGIVKAYEPADADPSDKAAFQGLVKNLPPEATVVLPVLDDKRKFDLEMLESESVGGGVEIIVKRADKLETNIAKLLLGQNLSTEAGGHHAAGTQGAAGTRAAPMQDSVRKDYMFADSQSVGDMLKHQVIKPFVRLNFTWLAEAVGCHWEDLVPDATYQVEPSQDKMQTAQAANLISQAAKNFFDAAAPVDIRALCEQTEIPVLDKDDTSGKPPHAGTTERPYGEPGPGGGQDADPERDDFDGEPEEELRSPLAAVVRLGGSKAPQGAKRGGREGQAYVERLTSEARIRLAKLLAANRKEILKIATGPGSYEQRKHALAKRFSITDTVELRSLMRHLLLASNLAGRAASKVDAKGQ